MTTTTHRTTLVAASAIALATDNGYSNSLYTEQHARREKSTRGKEQTSMHRTAVRVLIVKVMILVSSLLAWPEMSAVAAPRLKIATTIFPLYDFVRHVAGPTVDVVLLLPPGASPHTFEPRPGTMRALTGSTVLFAIGHGLDDWAVRLAQGANVQQTRLVDQQITLHPATHVHDDRRHTAAPPHAAQHSGEGHAGMDPHYWLSVANAVHIVHTIAETLGTLDAAAREDYRQRMMAYVEQLHSLDGEIRRLLANLPRRQMATFHAAFDYFADAYALEVVATFEPTPGQEPSPRHVEAFLKQVRAHNLRTLFIEPQLPHTALQSLARDLGVTLKELDPNGGSPGRDSYIAMMRFNAAQIAAALQE
jgi:ABC-type Zn uptake system ZnuABC Zn-binding protein ZnuA